jgi:post-segregation antitoxin (ccd killing protein)
MAKTTRAARSLQTLSASRTLRSRAKKVSLTVDEGVLTAMEREAKKSKRTLSAEVTEALARELRRRRLEELVVSYERENGAITAQELATIQAEWQG